MNLILSVAAGGAAGAVARYLVMGQVGHWLGLGFPFGTLAVNVVGSLLLGALVETGALAWSMGAETRAFLVVGALGSFTTFSTFSLDVVALVQRGDLGPAAVYVVASVVLALVGFMLGLVLVRIVLA